VAAIAYHFHMGRIQRSRGDSAPSFAAYCGRQAIRDERTGELYNHSRRKDLVYSQIFTPPNAPEWTKDRGELWNQAEAVEKRKDSQTAITIDAAIPKALDDKHRDYLIKNFVRDINRQGIVADVNMHKGHEEGKAINPHVHIMLTTRQLEDGAFSKGKYLALDKKQTLEEFREKWATMSAALLERMGHHEEAARWQHGHLKLPVQKALALERGDLAYAEAVQVSIDRGESQHKGRAAMEIERRGGVSHRMETIHADQREAQALAAGRHELKAVQEEARYLFGQQQRGKYDPLRETHELVERQLKAQGQASSVIAPAVIEEVTRQPEPTPQGEKAKEQMREAAAETTQPKFELQTPEDLLKEVEERQRRAALHKGQGKGLGIT
jgi:hypothetical protein